MKNIICLFAFLIMIVNVIAQSKKNQILTQQGRIDSLTIELKNEKSSNKNYQIQIEKLTFLNDSLKRNADKENIKFRKSTAQYEDVNNNLKLEIERKKTENTLLQEKLNLLIKQNEINIDENKSDTDLRNQYLKLKQTVSEICKNELALNLILNHITNRYNEHIKTSDSLLNLPEDEIGGYENLTMQYVYSNKNFVLYEVNVDGFYGGAHPEQWIESYLFDLHTGSLKELHSLILQNQKAQLLQLINKKLKQEERELSECIGNNENSGIQFTLEDLNYISLVNNGIQIEYYISYAERACNPIIGLTREEASQYFDKILFE